jgi:hypothetical protein
VTAEDPAEWRFSIFSLNENRLRESRGARDAARQAVLEYFDWTEWESIQI